MGAEFNVDAGQIVEIVGFIQEWVDGTHDYTLEVYDGSTWSAVSGNDLLDGYEYPSVSGWSVQDAWFEFAYQVPEGVTKARVKQAVVGASTGCVSLVLDKRRYMLVIAT